VDLYLRTLIYFQGIVLRFRGTVTLLIHQLRNYESLRLP